MEADDVEMSQYLDQCIMLSTIQILYELVRKELAGNGSLMEECDSIIQGCTMQLL